MLRIIICVGLLLLVGCASGGTPLERRAGAWEGEPWKVELDAEHKRWKLAMAPGCVLAWGRRLAQGERAASRLLQCHDPSSGERLWRRELSTQGGASEGVDVVGERIIYHDSDQVVALEADTGRPAWRFDPAGRLITGVQVDQGRLLVSLNHDLLLWLDARDGGWGRGVQLPDHRLLGSYRGDFVAVQLEAGADGALLVAVPQEGEGGRDPAPPFPFAEPRWGTGLPATPARVSALGEHLVVELNQGGWQLLKARSGELVHAQAAEPAAREQAPGGARGSQTPFPGQDDARLAALSWDELRRAEGLPLAMETLLEGAQGPWLLGERARQGAVLPMREVTAVDPARLQEAWTAALPTAAPVQRALPLPQAGALLLMAGGQGVVLDLKSGAWLARPALPEGGAGWTDVASQGQGLYVVYGHEAQPRLEGWPLSQP